MSELEFESEFFFFFLQSSSCGSNEQCLKTIGLYDDLLLLCSLLHVFYFIFSAPILLSFPISPPLFFVVLSQGFIKCNRNLLYTYMYINSMHNIF